MLTDRVKLPSAEPAGPALERLLRGQLVAPTWTRVSH
jgi:hypothetical protein